MDDLMRKTLNHDNTIQGYNNNIKNHTNDVVVPRDFMIKTAYVKKRRNTTNKNSDTQSMHSR